MNVNFREQNILNVLRQHISRYNTEHPGRELDTESLFQAANDCYFKGHPERYRILSHWLEPELTEEPPFISRVQKNYNRTKKADEKKEDEHYLAPGQTDYVPPFYNEDLLLDETDGENFLRGEFLLGKEIVYDKAKSADHNEIGVYDEDMGGDDSIDAEGEITIIREPSLLYYTLARVVHMDERTLMDMFYNSNILNVSEYNTYFAYDVMEYYFTKSGYSTTKLEEMISTSRFKHSTLSNLMNRSTDITFEQFKPIAEALEIPEKWVRPCRARLAQKYDEFSFMAGYQAYEDDLMDNTDEMLISLYVWGAQDKTKQHGTVTRLFRYLGYEIISDIFPKQIDADDPDARHNTYIDVIPPKDSKYLLNRFKLDDYEEILEHIISYADFYMKSKMKKI
ncbi:MAG: hypothetical protein NC548_35310 [Lachnospiraceae bacterium]|nr:hypothetical protein [Lachnospiraceae bacterium]